MTGEPTILASASMTSLFVLAAAPAVDRSSAAAVLVDQAAVQWGIAIDLHQLPNPVRLWYKESGDVLAPCRADDPDALSQWWVFSDVSPAALRRHEAA